MVLLNSIYILLTFRCALSFRTRNFEVSFEKFVCMPGEVETLIEFVDWKVSRDHIESKISGKINWHANSDDAIFVSLGLEYTTPAKKVVKHPFKIQNSTWCDFYSTAYNKYLAKSFKGHSNFPEVSDQNSCPAFPRKLWAENASMELNFIPSVTPRGLWKGELNTLRNDKKVGGLIFYVRLK